MTNETPSAAFGQPLTARENEVCLRVCKGLSNKEIARELGISRRTVEDHRMHAMKKHGAANVVHLVRKVYKLDDRDAWVRNCAEIVDAVFTT